MASSLQERQNSSVNLRRLAAQRLLYTWGKGWETGRFLTTGLLVSAAFLLSAFAGGYVLVVGGVEVRLSAVAALVAVLALVLEQWLFTPRLERLRTEAARIQEAFDVDVLALEWNTVLVDGTTPAEDAEILAIEFAKRGGDLGALRDWYPSSLGEVPVEVGRLIAQRSNAWWDATLRNQYLKFLAGSAFGAGAVVVVVAFLANFTLEYLMVRAVLPLSPVALYVGKTVRLHRWAAHTRRKLLSILEAGWRDVLSCGQSTGRSAQFARSVQDEIFRNRVSAPMVPEWMYVRGQARMERSAVAVADRMVGRYQEAIDAST